MRKLLILAISAILVTNISAQEQKQQCEGKKLSKEERVEFDIKRFTHELMLSDKQAEKFAATYREYSAKMDELFQKRQEAVKFEPGKELTDADLDKMAKARFEGFKELANLQAKFYDKFRKDLSARQVEKVLRLNEPFGGKPCCGGKCGKGEGPKCDGKHDGKKCDGKHGKHEKFGPRPDGPRPEGPFPAPKAE